MTFTPLALLLCSSTASVDSVSVPVAATQRQEFDIVASWKEILHIGEDICLRADPGRRLTFETGWAKAS